MWYNGAMDKKSLWSAATFLVVYTGMLLGGMAWMIDAKISPIEHLLTNHITDTNKKIDAFRSEIKEEIKEVKESIQELLKKS